MAISKRSTGASAAVVGVITKRRRTAPQGPTPETTAAVVPFRRQPRAGDCREAAMFRRLALEAERGDIVGASVVITKLCGTIETIEVPEVATKQPALLRQLAVEAERGDIRQPCIVLVRPNGTVENLGDIPGLLTTWRA